MDGGTFLEVKLFLLPVHELLLMSGTGEYRIESKQPWNLLVLCEPVVAVPAEGEQPVSSALFQCGFLRPTGSLGRGQEQER